MRNEKNFEMEILILLKFKQAIEITNGKICFYFCIIFQLNINGCQNYLAKWNYLCCFCQLNFEREFHWCHGRI